MGTLAKTPPKPDEIELTLFGPGYGESIAVHVEGKWLLIDSCVDPSTGNPAAIDYLTGIGVDLGSVALVICTHWHDDHARGIAACYRACPNAKLVLSGALQRLEFLKLLEAYERWPNEEGKVSSGLDEMRQAVAEAKKRDMPRFASEDQRLWMSQSGNAELYSLTPSAATMLKAFSDISLLLPQKGQGKRRAYVQSPNHIAVALHLRVGPVAMLLGSDLEEENDPLTGWSAVLASTTRPTMLASIYKVAHHGSITGEHPGVWAKLLAPAPTSVMTPFSKSALPTTADQARVKSNSAVAILTARTRGKQYRRHGALAKLIRRNNVRSVNTEFGVVRSRGNVTNNPFTWEVELEGSAHQL
jgi:hypothetical protein